jgi:hypothetical protein
VTDGEGAVLRRVAPPMPLESMMARSSTSTPSSTLRRPSPQGSSSGACFVLLADALPFSVCVGSSWDCDLAGFCGSGHRNMASRARWVKETGAAEVVESRGNLWLTTGVTRAGKLYYNVEEIGYANCSMKCRICVAFDCTGPIAMVCCASSRPAQKLHCVNL